MPDELPFGGEPVTGWRAAPDCGRCNDTGRYREAVEAHCTCKRGRRMAELWIAEKLGVHHPDEYVPSEPPDINEEHT